MKQWFAVLIILLTGASMLEGKEQNDYTVICLLEAKEGKENELKTALTKVAIKSRKEASNIVYKLIQDQTEPTKFALYEIWKSKDLHQEQFQKPYIIELLEVSKDLLEGSYSGVFGNEVPLSKEHVN